MRRALVMLVLLAACDRGATNPPPPPEPGTTSPPAATRPSAQPQDLSQGLLVVEWDAELRSELETMISMGRAILLAGDRPLLNCHGPATNLGDEAVYTLRGAALREERSMVNGATLDATYVGNLDVTKFPRDTRGLQGECDGATHVVRAIDVGAFELFSSSSSQTKTEVPLAGGGVVGGSKTSSSSASSKSGDRSACAATNPPPSGCRAVIRLYLHPLAR